MTSLPLTSAFPLPPVRMGTGPVPATIMLVGEAYGETEERSSEPFVGTSGKELNLMLHEAGIMRSECYTTNVVNARPPGNDLSVWIAEKKKDITPAHLLLRDRYVLPIVKAGYESLLREIELVRPHVIIAFGNIALWTLTGEWGISKWRGSLLLGPGGVKVIPTYHPAAILRQWDWRAIAVQDLRRARTHSSSREFSPPPRNYTLRPSLETTLSILKGLASSLSSGALEWIDFDLETRAGHIACAGLSWSRSDAICIPFMCVERWEGYWTPEEEPLVVHALYSVLTHPRVKVRGQNLLYDCQYTYRHWHFVPRVAQDTMISHHSMFSGLPKRLDFLASMYCENYRYWKDDGKTWTKEMGEEQLWAYNCDDCVNTREVGEVELANLSSMGLEAVDAFQHELFWAVLQAMQRGVRINSAARGKFALELQDEMAKREAFFREVLGHPLNPRSSIQMIRLFYDDLKIPPVVTRAKKNSPAHVSCDDKALDKIISREPIVIPLVKAIREYRSLGVFLSTFVLAPLDTDGRMRTAYNICGAETYRFSSSENAFGSGTNLQNVPSGSDPSDPNELSLPNVRKLFIPDPGYTFFDMDLDRADLQVVVWESDDEELRQALLEGVDMHSVNAKVLGISRPLAKAWVHGTNYGGGPRTMAANCGISIHQAELMRRRWFEAHPGIKAWHERTENELRTQHYVSNKFGYRRYYFDRVDGLLPQALAWIPQSTVACVINRAWVNIFRNLPQAQILLQVHDSLAGQFPTHLRSTILPAMQSLSRITVPYDRPLIIPTGIKTSEVSWGDCK